MKKRLFIVSNRLPLTVEQHAGEYSLRQSSGGLISAISAYMSNEGKDEFTDKIWAGVPGCSEKAWDMAKPETDEHEYDFLPVFINGKKYDGYYSGFSNSLIWPLFHYFPSFADYNLSHFEAYMDVNATFADLLGKKLRENDVVWIHDYHLLPLARMLREKFPDITIGFFLHIPFPSYELFRVIPKLWQKEILMGMLGADLIGFHTVDYAAHFLSGVEKALKVEHDGQYISWENRKVKADAFPISIDYNMFNNAYNEPNVIKTRQEYTDLKGDMKLLFSVDRLDYTKGVYKRLQGYRQFLLKNPEYMEKVIFCMVVVPSRHTITKYAERKKLIDEFIGNLNSTMGSISWQPVIYQYNHLSFEELVAMYTACDMALVTPLRDGMNLVAKEFVASRQDEQGVLVLSEMTGASRELTEALLINPNDVNEIAAMIKYGLEMKPDEQLERMVDMRACISRYDVNMWAADFFMQLHNVKAMQMAFTIKMLDSFARARLLEKYSKTSKRMLLLDYDGTLVPFSKEPMLAVPDSTLLEVLEQISAVPENEIYIISGRDSRTLETWLGHLPIGLIAEHGASVRHKGSKWVSGITTASNEWMPRIEKIMDRYVSRCPHSFIEQKAFSLAWHYRNADLIQGSLRARELYADLVDRTASLPLNVLNGNKVIEVRNNEINKGTAVDKLLYKEKYDFILAIGDDKTDEDMFKKLTGKPEAFTIKVGNEPSFAKYNLHTPYMVQSLLESIAASPKK